MVELYFDSPVDLLNDDVTCYYDEEYHIVGAKEIRITCPEDVVKLAHAVERRTMKGTRMNDNSSRSHCFTTLKCVQIEIASERMITSRLMLVDMMGSERMKGENSSHDTTVNLKNSAEGRIIIHYITIIIVKIKHIFTTMKYTALVHY